MARVKRGVAAHKRKKNVLAKTKGFRWGRKAKYKLAKQALFHGMEYAFRDRKVKKRLARGLWQTQISSASKEAGISYSKLINQLKQKNIQLDRKSLSTLAKEYPIAFKAVLQVAGK